MSSAPGDAVCLGYIDRYRVDSVIGTGGMGVVAAGFDMQLGRPVALKFLAPHLAGLAPARRRFTREARSAAAIVHPSIMPIYGVSDKSDQPYLVMPLVGSDGGRSLQDRIDTEGPLDLETSLGIAAQIAEGLAAAHQRGLVHRDIKPGNVLLEENSPRVLISDFGLARAIDDATVTVGGNLAGTPQYMSPEQAAGENVSSASDLFSLGSVLYAMLTGRPPFVAESPIAVLRKVIDTPAKPASSRVESLPSWVDQLIDQFLAKEPSARIASAADAADLLRAAESHVRHPSGHELPGRLKVSLERSIRKSLWIAATLTMIALATSPLWWSGLRSSENMSKASTTTAEVVEHEPSAKTPQPTNTAKTSETDTTVLSDAFVAPDVMSANTAPSIPSDDVKERLPDSETDLSWNWDEFHHEVLQIQITIDSMDAVSE
ncbi:MAG: serine/threonine protein kinase [Planctomycetales bacterium]|nr:serine/threonine protein kinase [Planctomycetales bacterium]